MNCTNLGAYATARPSARRAPAEAPLVYAMTNRVLESR